MICWLFLLPTEAYSWLGTARDIPHSYRRCHNPVSLVGHPTKLSLNHHFVEGSFCEIRNQCHETEGKDSTTNDNNNNNINNNRSTSLYSFKECQIIHWSFTCIPVVPCTALWSACCCCSGEGWCHNWDCSKLGLYTLAPISTGPALLWLSLTVCFFTGLLHKSTHRSAQ